MKKHEGAEMSSKFVALKYLQNADIDLNVSSAEDLWFMQTGNMFTLPNALKTIHLAYITVNAGIGPSEPNPNTAVPSVMIRFNFFETEQVSEFWVSFFKFYNVKYFFAKLKLSMWILTPIFPFSIRWAVIGSGFVDKSKYLYTSVSRWHVDDHWRINFSGILPLYSSQIALHKMYDDI